MPSALRQRNSINRFLTSFRNSYLIFTFLIASLSSLSQDLLVKSDRIGFNIGANFAVGSHFQRLGFNLNFYYVNGPFQANSELRAYFTAKAPGPKQFYPELVLSQGVLFGYGGSADFANPFLSSISNQTDYENSIAYSYNAWFNTVKTRQQTGIVAFQFGNISVIVENDILAHNYFDRFRTGGFLIQYQHEDKFQVAISSALWTGEMGRKTPGDSLFKTRCYMDTSGGHYTNISHGLLSAQFRYNMGLGQSLQANVGVDAEQVRNVVQNKIIHDLPFVPKKLIKPINCYIPMLDSCGHQYLYRPEQKIRSPRLFWNVFSNANVFY